VNVYLDASVIVSLFVQDAFVGRAEAFFAQQGSLLLISDFAAAEFSSAIARRVRMKEMILAQGQTALANFDAWTARASLRIPIVSADVETATGYLRRLDLQLRTGDAINIAVAHRLGASLLTFDTRMAASATALGVEIVTA
jgi:predicted nucleic acid-binding protein